MMKGTEGDDRKVRKTGQAARTMFLTTIFEVSYLLQLTLVGINE